MIPAERIKIAREQLLKYLQLNPKATSDAAARWLNNQRHSGIRLGLPHSEIRRTFIEARMTQAPIFNPPRLVIPTKATIEPPKPVAIQVTAPGMAEPETKFFIPGREERQKYAEDLALENPKRNAEWIRLAVKKKFGVGLDVKVIQAALELSRTAAGMTAKLRPPRIVEAPPVSEEPMPLPAAAPPPAVSPDEMLKEAGRKLKSLLDVMQWQKLVFTVTHDGTLDYDATPLPVLPAKGRLAI